MKKFLDASHVRIAIGEIAKMARGKNIRPVLAGGNAMQIYGSDRLTTDVDFLASAVPTEIVVEKPLSFGGVSGRSPGGFPVDIIVRNDDFAELYASAQNDPIEMGLPVPVVKPEYLAAMKLVAGRAKDEEDLKSLIRLEAIDLGKTREIIRKHLGAFAVKEFGSFVDEVAWRKSRGEE